MSICGHKERNNSHWGLLEERGWEKGESWKTSSQVLYLLPEWLNHLYKKPQWHTIYSCNKPECVSPESKERVEIKRKRPSEIMTIYQTWVHFYTSLYSLGLTFIQANSEQGRRRQDPIAIINTTGQFIEKYLVLSRSNNFGGWIIWGFSIFFNKLWWFLWKHKSIIISLS